MEGFMHQNPELLQKEYTFSFSLRLRQKKKIKKKTFFYTYSWILEIPFLKVIQLWKLLTF